MNRVSSNIDKTAYAIYLVSILLVSFYIWSPYKFWVWNPTLFFVEKVLIGVTLIVFILGFLFVKHAIGRSKIQFTTIDGLILFYGFYLILHGVLRHPIDPEPIFLYENLLLGSIYICYRNIKKIHLTHIFWIILLAGLSHVYFGILNQTFWFAPGFGLSDIKGNFINQGPFAGSIACALLLIFALMFRTFGNHKISNSFIKWIQWFIYVSLFICFLIILLYLKSRAAWIACFMAIAYFIWKMWGVRPFFRKVLNSRLKKLPFYTLGIAALSSIIFGLYHYKKDSADGRILIWKVGFAMIRDKPILGHGINSFQSNYMHYQADYFEQHPTHELRYLAGNNAYAFNEVLRLIAEQGLFGLGIILMVFYIFYRSTKKSNKSLPKNYMEFVSQSGLILIIVFGLFSYPLEILELKLMAVLFLAVLSTSRKKTISLPPLIFSTTKFGKWTYLKTIKKVLILGSISFVIYFSWYKIHKTTEVYKSFNYAISKFRKGDFDGFIHFGKSNYTTLKSNGYFLMYYGKSLFANQQYTEALALFEPALFIIPSTEVCIDIGKCYERLGDFKKAEYFWTRASNMVPAQFKPQYLIAKMYFENGQIEKAKKIASDLLINQKVKVYSIEVHQILEALKEIAK